MYTHKKTIVGFVFNEITYNSLCVNSIYIYEFIMYTRTSDRKKIAKRFLAILIIKKKKRFFSDHLVTHLSLCITMIIIKRTKSGRDFFFYTLILYLFIYFYNLKNLRTGIMQSYTRDFISRYIGLMGSRQSKCDSGR